MIIIRGHCLGVIRINQMTIQTILQDQSDYSIELKEFLSQLRPHIESYAVAKYEAQKQRMIIIGKAEEYRQKF